jgi:hypothetical protein
MLGSASALLVTILFLAFAVQVLVGFYATSTLRAALHDAASSAANDQVAVDAAALGRIAQEAEASLGRMGERTTIELEPVDTDGDGLADVIAGEARGAPPRVVPRSVGGMMGFEEIRVGVRVRVERPR